MRRHAKKKSNILLWAMMAAIIAIVALLILWNPTSAKAASQTSEEDKIEMTTIAKQGTMAPDFTVEMFDGNRITLSELRGKVVLVNFWATWCPPCRAELKRVQSEIIDRFKDCDFVFIPISRGEQKQKVADFRAAMKYTFPMGLDTDQSIFRKFASNYIPRNFLIDREGRIVLASVGYDEADFEKLIQEINKSLK